MNKKVIRDFFNKCAPTWDSKTIRNEDVINAILNDAGIIAGVSVLDVACGTGVLFSDYLERNVASVVGVDLSCNMVEIARSKFKQSNIDVICVDVETWNTDKLFDRIMIYNAFPHFLDEKRVLDKLVTLLKPGGIITIAHGMSREWINCHHEGCAKEVSHGLMTVDELADLFEADCKVLIKVSTKDRYQVSAQKIQNN